jgi:SAM-dependent methyltransferase
MLEFVAAQARAAGLATVATHACAAEDLPRDQAPFDAAICRLGLMLMPNPAAVVAAVRDVLRPGGRFGALVFDPREANPFNVELVEILSRHARKSVPASGPGFFPLADRAVLTALFEDAGLTGVTVTALDASHSLPSVADAVRMIREAFAGIWGIIADQPQAVQDAAWAEVRAAFSRFETAGGFVAPAQFHVVGGRKPG